MLKQIQHLKSSSRSFLSPSAQHFRNYIEERYFLLFFFFLSACSFGFVFCGVQSTRSTLFLCFFVSCRRDPPGVLLRAMREVQRHGPGAPRAQSGGSVRPLRPHFLPEDRPHDSHTAGESVQTCRGLGSDSALFQGKKNFRLKYITFPELYTK